MTSPAIRGSLAAVALAVALTWVFWSPLWTGGGLIGGDVYSYFLPQKTLYADSLGQRDLPLWNNRTGFGYPVLAESQTAAAYPLNLPLYALLDVHSAYNASHLLHYVAAFLGTIAFARSLGLSYLAASFAALVYVYGWFPARSCLEWAIIGGAYLPWMLWCLERFAQTRRAPPLLALAALIGMQLLAGHYNLAFISHLTLAAYGFVRLKSAAAEAGRSWWPRGLTAAAAAILLGYGLAAVQLAPSWELSRRSQRSGEHGHFAPAYGHIPPLYWLQTVTPWMWYGSDIDLDRALTGLTPLAVSAATNRVEAHLYFGLIPVALLVARVPLIRMRVVPSDPRVQVWWWFGLAALLYTSGWLVPLTRVLPGFGYFMGPGRYGIVTTLAVALLSASTLDELTRKLRGPARWALFASLFAVTAVDLRIVGRSVSYAVMVERPPILRRGESPIASILRESASSGALPRMFAPGPNLPTLTGAGCVPVYLGLGPIEYFTPSLMIPEDGSGAEARGGRIEWLRRAAVTHILSFESLDPREWPVEPVWSGFDPLLGPAWNRFGEPLHLYALRGAQPRCGFAAPRDDGDVAIQSYAADRIVVSANSSTGGRIVLRDLDYPGWRATVNGRDAPMTKHDGLFRAVDIPPGPAEIVWTYRPDSVRIGGAVSLVSLVILMIAAVRQLRQKTAVSA